MGRESAIRSLRPLTRRQVDPRCDANPQRLPGDHVAGWIRKGRGGTEGGSLYVVCRSVPENMKPFTRRAVLFGEVAPSRAHYAPGMHGRRKQKPGHGLRCESKRSRHLRRLRAAAGSSSVLPPEGNHRRGAPWPSSGLDNVVHRLGFQLLAASTPNRFAAVLVKKGRHSVYQVRQGEVVAEEREGDFPPPRRGFAPAVSPLARFRWRRAQGHRCLPT